MKYIAFWLVTILWLSSALPILAISLLSLEVPLWPRFGPDSTSEGRWVWGVVAIWFYLTPLLLLAFRRFGRRDRKA